MYYPGEPVRFRFHDHGLRSDGHTVKGMDYRLAVLMPDRNRSQLWLVWFLSDFEKPYSHSTRLLQREEPECRCYWVGEGRCQARFNKEGEGTLLDLPVTASAIKAMEEFWGSMRGEGAWLARLLKPGGVAGEIVQVDDDWLCYARLA